MFQVAFVAGCGGSALHHIFKSGIVSFGTSLAGLFDFLQSAGIVCDADGINYGLRDGQVVGSVFVAEALQRETGQLPDVGSKLLQAGSAVVAVEVMYRAMARGDFLVGDIVRYPIFPGNLRHLAGRVHGTATACVVVDNQFRGTALDVPLHGIRTT